MRVAVLPLFLSGVLFAACVPPESGGSGGTGGFRGQRVVHWRPRGQRQLHRGQRRLGRGRHRGQRWILGRVGRQRILDRRQRRQRQLHRGQRRLGRGRQRRLGTGGSGGSAAGDASTPGDTTSTPEPTAPGAFPGCPKCKSIFDGKTLDGWQQDPAGSFVVKERDHRQHRQGRPRLDQGRLRRLPDLLQRPANHRQPQALHHPVHHPPRRRQGRARAERPAVPAAAGRIVGLPAGQEQRAGHHALDLPQPAPDVRREEVAPLRDRWPAPAPASSAAPAARSRARTAARAWRSCATRTPPPARRAPSP